MNESRSTKVGALYGALVAVTPTSASTIVLGIDDKVGPLRALELDAAQARLLLDVLGTAIIEIDGDELERRRTTCVLCQA